MSSEREYTVLANWRYSPAISESGSPEITVISRFSQVWTVGDLGSLNMTSEPMFLAASEIRVSSFSTPL